MAVAQVNDLRHEAMVEARQDRVQWAISVDPDSFDEWVDSAVDRLLAETEEEEVQDGSS